MGLAAARGAGWRGAADLDARRPARAAIGRLAEENRAIGFHSGFELPDQAEGG